MSAAREFVAVRAAAVAVAAAALLAFAEPALAEDAPADSALRGYFRSMSDSTDAYFGLSAQPIDTTGLDSSLVYGLAHPDARPRGPRARLAFAPALAFNRAVGALYGASASIGPSYGIGRLSGTLEWANGPNDWYGGGQYVLRRGRSDADRGWRLTLDAGRHDAALDRDFYDRILSGLSAFVSGHDRNSYLRRDGVGAEIARMGFAGWGSLGYRDELESPLATTATWNLSGREPVLVANAPATFGRASELRVHAGLRMPRTSFTWQATAWNAGGALGGDLAYHRLRTALGGGIGLGRHFALAPQFEYARLTGSAPRQDLLYVGGPYSLLTVDSQSLSGTGRAMGRVELLMLDDVLAAFGLRRNPVFPIQLGAFATSVSRWGYDPASGEARLTPRDWPGSEQWMNEAGVSLLYRPGIPDPETFLRVDYAWPLGPTEREGRLYVSYKRTLHLLGTN